MNNLFSYVTLKTAKTTNMQKPKPNGFIQRKSGCEWKKLQCMVIVAGKFEEKTNGHNRNKPCQKQATQQQASLATQSRMKCRKAE